MNLGTFVFDAPVPLVLAPMAAVSELPFRRLALELGADWAPTELVSAEGLLRENRRTLDYLRRDPAIERPFCVQIFGSQPESLARAAEIAVRQGAEVVDVNMGCPVPKVTRSGAGAALMRDPARAAALVDAIRRAVAVPVTAKIRAGWDEGSRNAVEVARALEDAGVAALAVHGRTRAQGYSGRSDWGIIAEVRRAVGVPVIGNGDVRGPEDARAMVRETGCHAVMIGRGALGNPWIFREVKGGPAPTPEERRDVVLRHLREHVAHFPGGATQALRAFRTQLVWYARGLEGAARFRGDVMRTEALEPLVEAIDRFFAGARAEAPRLGAGVEA